MSDEAAAPIVVMGVSGSGKSTVGALLADRLGMPFVDADDLHDATAKVTMAAGVPLGDADRWPWLDRVGARLARAPRPVVACSALRRVYRERLLVAAPATRFVHLDVDEAGTARRMLARSHEYMPASLLASQLATLEPLGSDEPGLVVDGSLEPRVLVELVAERVRDALPDICRRASPHVP